MLMIPPLYHIKESLRDVCMEGLLLDCQTINIVQYFLQC